MSGSSHPLESATPKGPYWLYGAAFGAVFPAVATLLHIGLEGLPFSPAGFITAQAEQPLLWIIDAAPFVLGTFSALLGQRQLLVDRLLKDAAALRVSEELDRVFELSLDPMSIVGFDGVFHRVSPGFTKVLGHTTEDLRNVRSFELIHPDDADDAQERTAQLRRGQSIGSFEVRIRTKSGEYRWIQFSAIPVMEDEVFYFVGRDVTDERDVRQELIAAKDAAEEASRTKSEFLANMSHEIRTPMNGVLGMTALVLDSELSREQRDFVEAIDESAKTLLSVINDLLDFSKIETGKLALATLPFPLSETFVEPLRAMARRAAEKGIDLVYEEGETLPAQVVGDQGRMRQMFINLVDNAIKFTAQGEVFVSLVAEPAGADRTLLSLTVRDTGIGLSDDVKGRIFEAFSQGDGSHTRLFGGTGLGLTIASRLAGMMGGELTVESAVGEGSTFRFTVTLPVAKTAVAERSHPLAGRSVLVVDHNATERHVLSEYLERWGVTAVPAESPVKALEVARAMRAAGRPIDVVLGGVRPSDPEAVELYARLSREPDFGPVRVVVIVSSRLQDVDALLSAHAEMVHLPKPVFPSQLLDVLMSGLGSPEDLDRFGAQAEVGDGGPQAGARALLVEDNRVNQMLVATLLRRRGYSVTLANNGVEALELFGREEFDFILMDVQMPEMDGLEATRRIRELESDRLRRVPIIAVTAHSMKGDRETCLAAGMDDYVVKPVDPVLLEEAIARRFHAVPADFESARALELVSGDEGLLASIVRLFLDQAPDRLEAIHRALARHDATALGDSAHTLEGTAERLAMPRLRAVAHQIAVLSHRGDFDQAEKLLAELDAAVGSGSTAVRRAIDAA